ncbi:hypothetical protein C8J57DRAFT_1233868 [Mycena rebaudengoi]|nr:hypothetical protein C8J57DRAFT_1233868 [Mycena rebaudengoi]
MADSKDTSSSISSSLYLRNQISELDAHILALKTSLAAVRCERKRLESRLDDYKNTILSLPLEITAEIFRAAARDRRHGSTAPVERVPCPLRQPFSPQIDGTATARFSSSTAR